MNTIVNLTPHKITFVGENGSVLKEIEPSGQLARVAVKTVKTGFFDDLPITESVFGEVEGLPDPCENTVYIVSSLVAQRCRDRSDVFIPNESVRDANGRIIGCLSLGRI